MLTKETILSATDNKALFGLLSAELNIRLPRKVQVDADIYHGVLLALPRGLRAMAGIHFLDVSLCIDDLAWHFLNQYDPRAIQETYNGLLELEMPRVAELFKMAWNYMKPYLALRHAPENADTDGHDWLKEIGAEDFIEPLNKEMWALSKAMGPSGLLESWTTYARKYPGRCVDKIQ